MGSVCGSFVETRAYRPARNIFDGFRRWPKRCRILPSEKPVLWAFQDVTQAWPKSILFGQEGIIILRGGGRGEPCERLAVIPGHPFRWITLQRRGVPLQLGQIIERIGSVQLALSKAYAGVPAVGVFGVTTTRKPRASNPFTHFSMRRRIVSGVSWQPASM